MYDVIEGGVLGSVDVADAAAAAGEPGAAGGAPAAVQGEQDGQQQQDDVASVPGSGIQQRRLCRKRAA